MKQWPWPKSNRTRRVALGNLNPLVAFRANIEYSGCLLLTGVLLGLAQREPFSTARTNPEQSRL